MNYGNYCAATHGVTARVRACILAILALPAIAGAQSISIEPGARWQMGDASVDLDCAAVQLDGTLDAQDSHLDGIGNLAIVGQLTAASAALEVGGNWNNQGSFAAGAGSVRFSDRCGAPSATIGGSTQFSTLWLDSARGKAYGFAAGQVQSIASALRLAGVPGTPLVLGSTQAGLQASLALAASGNQHVAWVDVADMAAPEGSAWLAPGAPGDFNSVDSGNNFRWFEATPAAAAVPLLVPVDAHWALLGLVLALFAGARSGFRRRASHCA